MKKSLEKQLRQMCAALPVKYKRVKVKTPGSKLLRLGYKKDNKGNPLNKKKIYEKSEKVKVDHFVEVKKIFLEKGIEAVADYCNSLLQPATQELLSDKIAQMQAEQGHLNQSILNLNNNDGNEQIDLEFTSSTSRINNARKQGGEVNSQNATP